MNQDVDKLSMRFRVLDETVSVETDRLPEHVRPDELLPAFKILDDQAIEIAVRKNGRIVSCKKGCSMCCRIQPVPVTPAESYALLRSVEALAEPERFELLARFADRVGRLREAGLADDYLDEREAPDQEQSQANATRYLDLGLACPFLEKDACSIYENRPFACREYLVTSPNDLCARPLSEPIARVPIILVPGKATMQAAAALSGKPQFMIPLALALEYAEAHREELERTYPSAELLSQSIRQVFVAAFAGGSLTAEIH